MSEAPRKYKWIRVHYETWERLAEIATRYQCTMEQAILKLAELAAEQARQETRAEATTRVVAAPAGEVKVDELKLKEIRRRLWYIFKLVLSYGQWRYCVQNNKDPGWLTRYLQERINEIKKRFNVDTSKLEQAIQMIEQAAKNKQLTNKVIGEANDLIHDWMFEFLAQVFQS